jgi:hypothetical protein
MSRPERKYSIPRLYGIGNCLYKLSFNDRYVIVKAKDHQKSIEGIQKSLNQFMRNSELQRKPGNLYYHFFTYIEKQKEGLFQVEILLESTNAYELLKAEQTALKGAGKDKKCLNNNTEAYVPDYNEITGMYGWIQKTAVLNFRKWLKSHKGVISI